MENILYHIGCFVAYMILIFIACTAIMLMTEKELQVKNQDEEEK